MIPFSKLPASEKQDYMMVARYEIYDGTEPVDPKKEACIKTRAKELYDAHCRLLAKDNVILIGF